MAAAAMDAARAAGASYADVRLSRTLVEEWTNPFPAVPGDRAETHGAGVRVLVNGYWGFLGSATWTMDEMARLARGAVIQARANALGRTRALPLAPTPPVVNGEWSMPIKYDPFEVSYGEKYDFFNHVLALLQRHGPPTTAGMTGKFTRTDTVFASSEGSSWAQTTYLSMGSFGVGYGAEAGDKKYWNGSAGTMALSPAGRGWEHFIDSGVLDLIPQLVNEAEQSRDRTPVDVGRYDLVCTAECTAALIDGSVGAATELDRALGYEANADGTSYLDQPLDMLGTYPIGSSLLNVTANRSHPGGCATVKWDDEAVVPDDFTLVQDGVLMDYQTTRAQVNTLESYYSKINRPLRSHGCASSESGSTITMENLPNVQMMPGAKDTTFEELVRDTGKGVALVAVQAVPMDPQQLNGMAFGSLREIRNGKLGRFLTGAAVEFRAPNLWKSLDAIGGPSSTRWIGLQSWKGEPRQSTFHSVGAVPARFKNVAVIDFMRKA
jgi:TldD protein